jgi:hypothetical protein
MNWSNAVIKRVAGFAGILMLMFFASGCQSGGSDLAPTPPAAIPGSFSNADWATVLSAIATPDGYVKWDLVQSNADGVRGPLMAYIGLINAVSPGNHPELFASADDRLAYWINAYNAMCVYAVVEHNYPATMLAGQPPGAIFSDEEFTFGTQAMTLDGLVRSQLESAGDPRIFLALSFCAISGPPLRSTPYDGAVLDAELVDQGQRYLSDPRAAVRDGDAVKLNDLLTSMHAYDFLAGFKKLFGIAPTGLLQALQPYVQSDSPIVGATRIENLGFDWSLNRPPR